MRFAMLLLLVPAVASADPAPTFEILDRGNAVEVIAHNVTAAKTAITPIRSRLEVPLVGHPRADKALPTDANVKLVEFDGNEPRVLSVKTGFERTDVKTLAKYAQAIQVGSDVHILFPRAVPVEGAAVVLPEPTLPAAIAAKVAAVTTPAPVVAPAPEPKTEAKIEAPKADAISAAAPVANANTETKVAGTIEPKTEPKAEPKTETKTDIKPATAAPTKDDPWQKLSMYAAIALAAVGCGVWMLRRRKASQFPANQIDVIAQKSLGAKAKVVWFTAGGREMVVAVTPQSVRMLGQWKKPAAEGSGNISLPQAHALAETRTERHNSPAVNGILKLRERASMQNIPVNFAVNDEVATDDVDADAVWAQEILAATGARR